MNNIKTFEQFFWGDEASGVLPIALDTKRILIGLRSSDVLEPHTWGNFGGAIGLDDWGEDEEKLSPKENALKEMSEELGGFNSNMDLIDAYVFKSDSFRYYNFIGVVEKEFEVKRSDLNWEVDDVRWVTFEELLKLEPKHFGLKKLIEESSDIIKSILDKSNEQIN